MKMIWNHSKGRTYRADRVDILVTREEVNLDFSFSGTSGKAPDSPVSRVVVNPYMAKRLATALDQAIKKHENAYGSIDSDPLAGAKYLLDLIRDLHVPHGFEYSFKTCERLLLANRFLVTMHKDSLGEDYRDKVLAICAETRAPDAFMEAIEEKLAAAWMLHFGFEGSEKGGMHKVYLEFPLPAVSEPTLLHLSYKWDPVHPERCAVGRYIRYPLVAYEELAGRIRELLEECHRPGAFEIADAILRLAVPHVLNSFHYLEVSEEGNPRRSFDVNLYAANLTMGDIRPQLLSMAERNSLRMDEFCKSLDTVSNRKFGHLAGGIDREGRDFFTIHFGVVHRGR